MAESSEEYVNATLTFATYAAFAIPEVGVIVAGLLAIGQQFYNSSRIHGSSVDIGSRLQTVIDRETIQSSTDAIELVAQNFRSHFDKDGHRTYTVPPDIQATFPTAQFSPFANFYLSLRHIIHENLIDGQIDALMHATATETTSSRAVLSLNEFMRGVSVYLSCYKTLMRVEDEGQVPFDIAKGGAVTAQLGAWRGHVERITQNLDREIEDRLSKISEVKDSSTVFTPLVHLFRVVADLFSSDQAEKDEKDLRLSHPGEYTYFTDTGPMPVDEDLLKKFKEMRLGAWINDPMDDQVYVDNTEVAIAVRGLLSDNSSAMIATKRSEYVDIIVTDMRNARGHYQPATARKIVDQWHTFQTEIEIRIERERLLIAAGGA